MVNYIFVNSIYLSHLILIFPSYLLKIEFPSKWMEDGTSLVFRNVIMEFVLSSVAGWQGCIQAIMFLRGLIRIHTSGRWYCIFPGLVTLIIYGWDGLPGSVGAWKRYMGEWLLLRHFFIFSHCISHWPTLSMMKYSVAQSSAM